MDFFSGFTMFYVMSVRMTCNDGCQRVSEFTNNYNYTSLNCHIVTRYPYTPVENNSYAYKPSIVTIADSLIDKLNSTYFEQIDTSNVTEIELINCSITSIEADAFKTVSRTLESIELHDIEDMPHFSFNNLPKLSSFDLWNVSNWNLSNRSMFQGTNSLKYLTFHQNNLTDISPFTQNCRTLLRIVAIKNKIDQFPNISSCGNISFINLSSNKISHITASHLQKLVKLDYLVLSDNPLFEEASIPVGLFRYNSVLETLFLDGTGIKNLRNGTFLDLHRLTFLGLSRNKLKHLSVGVFADLISLRDLDLNNNQLSTIQSSGVFFGLQKLTYLYLCNNKLKQLSNSTLSELRSLLELHVSCNPLEFFDSGEFSGIFVENKPC